MRVIRVTSAEQGTKLGADIFIESSSVYPRQPVGLATGETMHELYRELADLPFRPLFDDVFLLDEYVGLPPNSSHSFESDIVSRFCGPLGYRGRVHVPGQGAYSGTGGSERFEDELDRRGPLSVQLLGLGKNGHVAFNEPGSDENSITRQVTLTEETREANRRHFPEGHAVPTHAVTQGIATIRKAHSLLLLVFGPAKTNALTRSLAEKSPDYPLSSLVDHTNLTIITDIELPG